MKHPGITLGAVAIALLSTYTTCSAQSNPWNGSWKMDASSLQYDGYNTTFKIDADGYTMDDNPKTTCDGKPHEMKAGLTTCNKTPSGYHVVVTKDGKKIRDNTLSVTADGKTATLKSDRTPSNGAPYTISSSWKRLSGGPGLAGTWKQLSFHESDDTGIMKVNVSGNTITFQETDTPKPMVCKLDGTPTDIGDGATISIKLADPHTLKVTYSVDGKVRRENTFILSADGKTVHETDLTPPPATSKMTATLHKM
ncbi:MAG: hypothetical protein JSS95_10290 [Acidobacteria bacterium]|nr:hypothetical protein [Acidobacteriota bacterium]